MPSGSVREEGFSKDADKLVRRLSLVALLLSRRGRYVPVAEIRASVEGYPTMTEDAFKRRFYEDRAELAGLGIAIVAEPGDAGAELYSLPAAAYYLPPVELSHEELTALAACLAVLEGRFAYSQPLRLALLSLAQGRPELLEAAETPPLTVVPETGVGAAALPKLQAAVADRKTVRFAYYAISRDQEMERTVDPYGLQLVSGEWYLVGWCHLREAVRTFRLSRIRSRVTHATRAPHDFPPPAGFDIAAFRDRPAWQLAGPRGTARVRVAPAMAWWVEAHWAHCGTVHALDDGGIVYETAFADARPLLSWVLGLAEAAELLEPEGLRAELAGELARLEALYDRAPAEELPPAPAAPGARPRRRAEDDWRVEVDRFTRLTALTTYLLGSCERRRGPARRGAHPRRPAPHGRGAARRRPPPQPRQLRRRRRPAVRRIRGPRQTARVLRPRRAVVLPPGAPLAPAGRHAAARRGARRRPAAHRLGSRPGERRRQAAGGAFRGLTDACEQRPPRPRRRRPRRRQHGHRAAPAARDRLLDRGHRPRDPPHRRAVSARPQPRRVVLRLLVPYGRRGRASSASPPPRPRSCSTRPSSRAPTWSWTSTGARASLRRAATRRAPRGCGTAASCGAGSRNANR